MTRSLRIRGLPGQLQLGRESRTFSGEGPPTWPSSQDLRDITQGNLTGKKPASRENGAGLSKFEETVRNRQEIQKKENYPTWKGGDRKSTRLNSSHANISYAVFCLKKKQKICPLL